MIKAQVVGDSLSPQSYRLTTLLVTMPRYILAELNTHRMLSKNSASSRAIPTKKLLEMVERWPFIPIAWQKEHTGMQGSEYFTSDRDIGDKIIRWLGAKDKAVESCRGLLEEGTTKQMANRLLEPFMYHTVLISGTEWENFFELRCPQYEYSGNIYRSRKDCTIAENLGGKSEGFSELQWLMLNKGQADIHMMATAEAIWDAMNESTPKQLKAGEWHIPFENRINLDLIAIYMGEGDLVSQVIGDFSSIINKDRYLPELVKISTAMAARTSYTVVGDEKEISYERLIAIHDKMAIAKPFHASPFEHCAQAMGIYNYGMYAKHYPNKEKPDTFVDTEEGWCRNFRGFIQYRHIIENR